MDIKKEYIGKYRQLVNQHDIDNFYVNWYGQAYRMFVAGDKKEFAEACSFSCIRIDMINISFIVCQSLYLVI